jgi:capsular exopolysaccharide synthesis family protein
VTRDPAALTDYASIIARRKLVVLVALVIVPAVAYGLSVLQDTLYEAEAHVLINRQSLASTLAGTTDPTIFQDAERVVQTQAELASVPEVAERAVRSVPSSGLTGSELLRQSDVEPQPNVDLLEFTVRHEDPASASRLATAYASAFTRYRAELDAAGLERALDEVRERIANLQAEPEGAELLGGLRQKEEELLTLQALQTGYASVVRSAGGTEQVQPKPIRNALLGVALGLGLGLLLAFLADALDTRIRSSDELAERLGLTLLGRLPPPPRSLRRTHRPVLAAEPDAVAAEAFRMLRTNIDFANLDLHARSIMVTSGLDSEGKSTTAANLALAYAYAGRHVALVDLDLRRPMVSEFFRIKPVPGITDIALGYVSLRRALVPVATWQGTPAPSQNGNRDAGTLFVAPAGRTPPNPGEFVGSEALGSVFEELRGMTDIVVVDAPPLLQVGDAMSLSARVDAILLVTRLKALRRSDASELKRLLSTSPAATLGFAITNASAGSRYAYGAYQAASRRRGLGMLLRWGENPEVERRRPVRPRR